MGNNLKQEAIEFPIEVFPKTIRHFLSEANKTLRHPIETLGASALFTASVMIGKTTKLRVKNNWTEGAVLYIMLISDKGTNKTHAMTLPMLPIVQNEKRIFKEYKKELKRYKSLNRDEKEEEDPPACMQMLINDITIEAIPHVLETNPRGLGYFRDELSSWIRDLNRYRKGSDEQFWLSNYNSAFCRINRTGKPPVLVDNSFISVFGSIQPGILKEIFSEERTINGFVERILPIFLEDSDKPYFNEEELNQEIVDDYVNLMNRLLKIELKKDDQDEVIPRIIEFDDDARKIAIEWHDKNVDETNSAENEDRAMISKADMVFYRLCLILQILNSAEENKEAEKVCLTTVLDAIKLIEYFKSHAKKVIAYNNSESSPLSKLNKQQLNVFLALPEYFTTSEAVMIAKDKGMQERTLKTYLNNRELFVWIKQGQYQKLLLA